MALLLGTAMFLGYSSMAPDAQAAPNKSTGKTATASTTAKVSAKPVARNRSTNKATAGKYRVTASQHRVAASPHNGVARGSKARQSPRDAYQARVLTHRRGGPRAVASGTRYAGMSCVPYARMATGMTVTGNAWQWWDNAAGTYARGKMPESGSILSFRSNTRMRMGHVAVVSRVVNARQVLIDHANWPTNGGRNGRGAISRNVAVVDVSEANDWSAVRVQHGRGETFGSVYPTHGFIYDRPDTGLMRTAVAIPAPRPALNPAPQDLRPAAERPRTTAYDEVAEAPMRSGQYRSLYNPSGWSVTTQQTGR